MLKENNLTLPRDLSSQVYRLQWLVRMNNRKIKLVNHKRKKKTHFAF